MKNSLKKISLQKFKKYGHLLIRNNKYKNKLKMKDKYLNDLKTHCESLPPKAMRLTKLSNMPSDVSLILVACCIYKVKKWIDYYKQILIRYIWLYSDC